jgi:hypothetical protein
MATQVVVPGSLQVDVFRHDLMSPHGAVRCWTFVSDGLHALRHKEVCLTVKMERDEDDGDYPRSTAEIYSVIHDLARQSHFADAGAVIGPVEGANLLDHPAFTGVAFSIPQPFKGVRRPADALTALILTTGELEVIRNFGMVRVEARLGDHYRFFPTAPWFDRRRGELLSLADMETSVLARVLRLPLMSDAVVSLRRGTGREPMRPLKPGEEDREISLDGGEVVLEVTASGLATIRQAFGSLPIDQPVALLTAQDPAADCCLVWRAGIRRRQAITAPGATGQRATGNHVIFIPAQSRNSVQLHEDGFVVQLTSEDWRALRRAFETDATSWSAPEAAPMTFHFRPT